MPELHPRTAAHYDDCAHVWRYDPDLDALVCTLCGAVRCYPSHRRINCGQGGGHDA